MREKFASLQWTRIISLQVDQELDEESWPMIDDVLASKSILPEARGDDDVQYEIVFEPKQFERVNDKPKLEDYRMDEPTLIQWGN